MSEEVLFHLFPCIYTEFYINQYRMNKFINDQIKRDSRNMQNQHKLLLLGLYCVNYLSMVPA